MDFDLITVIGLVGGAFYLGSHYMHSMVPLRTLSLCSNILFIIYAVFHLHFDWAKLAVLPEFLGEFDAKEIALAQTVPIGTPWRSIGTPRMVRYP